MKTYEKETGKRGKLVKVQIKLQMAEVSFWKLFKDTCLKLFHLEGQLYTNTSQSYLRTEKGSEFLGISHLSP